MDIMVFFMFWFIRWGENVLIYIWLEIIMLDCHQIGVSSFK